MNALATRATGKLSTAVSRTSVQSGRAMSRASAHPSSLLPELQPLIRARGVSPKMTVGAAGSLLEREAEATADRVLAAPEKGDSSALDIQEGGSTLRAAQAEERINPAAIQAEEREQVVSAKEERREQMVGAQVEDPRQPVAAARELEGDVPVSARVEKRDNTVNASMTAPGEAGAARPVSAEFEASVRQAQGRGQPLEEGIRRFMAQRFGNEFGAVRVHVGGAADRLNRSIGSSAFTTGSQIFFRGGAYEPGSRSGRHLLAHELTHVVQQAPSTKPSPKSVVGEAPVQRSILGAIGGALDSFAQNIPGYTLITIVVGYNPLTDKPVPRTAVNLLDALFRLVPGGGALFAQLNESGAVDRAFAWVSSEINKLGITWEYVQGLIAQARDAIGFSPFGLEEKFEKVQLIFSPAVRRIAAFGTSVRDKVLQFIFEGALKMVGAPVEKTMALLNKGAAVLGRIFADPIGFVMNLAQAVRLGLEGFLRNIGQHLLSGLVSWLLGALSKAGVTMPEKFDLKGVFSVVTQVLGLTYESTRTKLVSRIGEEPVSLLEKTFTFLSDLVTRGPIVLWEKLQDWLGDLKDNVLEGVRAWVTNSIIMKGIKWILGLLNPAGALMNMIMSLHDIVRFFLDRWEQITEFASSVFDAIAEIVSGKLGKAANAVEQALARSVPVMIGFLASLLGLGGISNAIRDTIAKIRKPVDQAVDKVLDWIVTNGKALLGTAKAGLEKGTVAVKALLFPPVPFTAGADSHQILIQADSKADPQMMIASEYPTAAREFVEDHVKPGPMEDQGKPGPGDALATLKSIEDLLKKNPLTDEEKAGILELENKLAKIIQKSIGDKFGKKSELHKLEGMVARYREMPRVTGDQMTPDHEPQKALLAYIGELPIFDGTQADKQAEDSKYGAGWCLNMRYERHKKTRTFSGSGKGTKYDAVKKIEGLALFSGKDPKKFKPADKNDVETLRNSVVEVARESLEADVVRVKAIYIGGAENFPDLANPEDEPIRTNVKNQGLEGATRILGQNLGELKN